MPHGHKHDLPKPYERLPEASQKRDRGLPGESKPTPNQKTILPKHCTPKPAQKPLDASKKLPKAFQKLPKGLPEGRPKPPQTRQNHPSNPCRECGQNWSRNPLKQSAGDSREPAAPPWGRQFVEWSVIVHLSTTRMSKSNLSNGPRSYTPRGPPPPLLLPFPPPIMTVLMVMVVVMVTVTVMVMFSSSVPTVSEAAPSVSIFIGLQSYGVIDLLSGATL